MPSTLLNFKGLRAGFSHVPFHFDIKITVNQTINKQLIKIQIKCNWKHYIKYYYKSQYGQGILLKKNNN